MEVAIEVTDVNDNAPVLGEIPYNILISEATLTGSHVITIVAEDKDLGTNGQFLFYGYSPERKFIIEPKSGAVKTASTFDFEQQSR